MNSPRHNEATEIVRRRPSGTASTGEKTVGVAEDAPTRPAAKAPRNRLAKIQKLLPKVGTKFLDFQLIAELGRGASGKVFLAQQGDLAGRYVALKVSADMFDESQTLAQLQHTNVVPIYSIHRVKPFLAVCMPYFGSTTIADVLGGLADCASFPKNGTEFVRILNDRQGTFGNGSPAPWLEETQTAIASADTTVEVRGGRRRKPEIEHAAPPPRSTNILESLKKQNYVEAVLWIVSRVAEGLAHAHERGILHLDLKPANILLTDEGQPMLLDFNLARDTKSSLKNAGPLLGGTVSYMSPEHIRAFRREKVSVDARSDLYALGLILYELLTGRPSFPTHDGPMKSVLERMLEDRAGPPPKVRDWNKAVSPAVESIVRRCLEPEPDRRYQNCQELIEDIRRQLNHEPLKYAPEPSLLERARKWFRRHPRLVSSSTAVIALEAVVIVALLAFTAARRQQSANLENISGTPPVAAMSSTVSIANGMDHLPASIGDMP